MATRAIDSRIVDSGKAGKAGTRADTRIDARARRYDPAETKQRVLTAANMLFSTKGFSATGTADIAREADVSEGSIFYHFGSKKALLAELGARYGQTMIEAMQGDDKLEDLEPGIIIPRVFEFCRTSNLWEGITGSECEVGKPAMVKNPEAEPFYHAAKATTTEWIHRQMTLAMARRGITDVDIEIAASFTHHIVGDAIERILTATSPEDAARVERETVRFVRAACNYPTA
ncbi:TetR/AcrR family transcriptional regulator [Sandarakinorhabdus sp. DWP1-3-1]|uniref:TetR/AcrR family transcriptional regulator n=1 Tax=Sandarakinorhabdus sp. DWP1-3-1 TaxID=2804627 RepID=UPI003CEEF139